MPRTNQLLADYWLELYADLLELPDPVEPCLDNIRARIVAF